MCCDTRRPQDPPVDVPPIGGDDGMDARELRLRESVARVLSRSDADDPCIAMLTEVVVRVVLEEDGHGAD
ncbi:hypothetical protein METUNv1_00049 [Methyloversatilis universalis FAM5]|jgi:hypothetical protein|uniref:Uncharacterized protein n=1 Tax=Methyloversatilis universalis (strain ATCC BAA-1314 / DSM 25237 / JCM 13912 / CCUG 52030 / FAM5) TaxID=1000565 RepID=F5R7B9_METUF|nr:hypothetical protein METUNv1_00049 [Methyloversatilis universalis FAM5]